MQRPLASVTGRKPSQGVSERRGGRATGPACCRRRSWRAFAAAGLCLSLGLAAGCSGDGNGKHRPEASAGGQTGAGSSKVSGTLAKDGWCGVGSDHCRIEMKQIERHGDRSVARFYVTNLGSESTTLDINTVIMPDDISFKLLDPLHHKGYLPLEDAEEHTIGSEPSPSEPGVRYEAVLQFPPIPEDVRSLTVITPTSAGEFTSVPVVDSGGPTTPAAPALDAAKPGQTSSWPTYKPQGKISDGGVYDLYGHTEGTVKSTTTSGTDEKIGLRTDVLFDFDSAKLSSKAKAVLDDVAAETKAKADPAKPPILVEGHTDGKGTHDYNIDLSQRRADAVLKELRARLGPAYQYKAAGKGESDPVAKEGGTDDEEARAKNRRVEISYKIKQRTVTTSTTAVPTEREQVGGGTGGAPAPFHKDGSTVASRTTDDGPQPLGGDVKRRIDVKPFYRDGDYLVAVFDIVNLGPGTLDADTDYGPPAYGDFTVVDPATGTEYENLTYGPNGFVNLERGDSGRAVYRLEAGTGNRGFFYVPAPPADVKTVTLDAGYFGKIPGIPIR